MILSKRNKVFEKIDPIYFLKSIKNYTEIKNMEKSHLIDGIALTKLDVLDELDEIKMCIAYEINGKKYD